MEKHTEERGQTSWNIMQDSVYFISNLLKKATFQGQQGQVEDKFFTLQSVRDNVNHYLKPEERVDLNKIEKAFDDCCKSRKKISRALEEGDDLIKLEDYKRNELTKKAIFIEYQRTELVREYHHAIMDLLEVMGFFPKKENRERLSF